MNSESGNSESPISIIGTQRNCNDTENGWRPLLKGRPSNCIEEFFGWTFFDIFMLIITCLLATTQIIIFFYFYNYISSVEKTCDNNIELMCETYNLNKIRIKREVDFNRIKSDLSYKTRDDVPFEKDEVLTAADEPIEIKNDSIFTDSGETEWVWINDYSRIPMKTVRTYCSKMQEYCPPAPKGEQGLPGKLGLKGDRGDKGSVGEKGEPGLKGYRGNKGPVGQKGDMGEKGETGDRGTSGLDGRDGAPGEPGIDGIPGRHGKDGIPGTNGIPGKDGLPGLYGQDGKDGIPGEKGEPGPQGPPGPTGLPGPRGRVGRSGTDGSPGIPGIQALNASVNGTSTLLLPPSIIGSEPSYTIRNVIVHEMDNIRMRCVATGYPKPSIVWRKVNGNNLVALQETRWGDINTANEAIQFPNISRYHAGDYMCIASNGIPPSANQSYSISVHFPPMIEIRKPIVNITIGGTARLECISEAYPRGVYYWETKSGDLIEETYGRYRVDNIHYGRYKTRMQLNITNVALSDLGAYTCISKNDEGTIKGYLNLTDLDIGDVFVIPKPIIEPSVTQIYGTQPPPPVGTLCPECDKCKVCGFGYRDLEIQPLGNLTYLPLPKKVQRCELDTIGKPVYHNSLNMTYGSWLKDLQPCNNSNVESIWVMLPNDTEHIYEYANKHSFTSRVFTQKHRLPYPYVGSSQLLVCGIFYYNQKNKSGISRYDLVNRKSLGMLSLPYADVSSAENMLFKTRCKYIGISMDENGLWAIYDISGNTAVVKINPKTFQIEHAWNISIKHHDVGDMFIVCGILYAIDSVTDFRAKINLALDLFENKLLDENAVIFTNPFGNTTAVNYNYVTKELYTWDAGNMLTYPIRLISHQHLAEGYNGTQDNSSNIGSDD